MPRLLILLLLTLWERQVKSKCSDSRSPIVQKKNKRRTQSLFSDPKVPRFSCLLFTPFSPGLRVTLLGGGIFFFCLQGVSHYSALRSC